MVGALDLDLKVGGWRPGRLPSCCFPTPMLESELKDNKRTNLVFFKFQTLFVFRLLSWSVSSH